MICKTNSTCTILHEIRNDNNHALTAELAFGRTITLSLVEPWSMVEQCIEICNALHTNINACGIQCWPGLYDNI